ncbi:ParB N-terminal domain-containing protein [Saccharopolyspora sp. 6V]|uniref:ParB/RepB/Spo0J family partition protein n=1 Tax=Saccharopolyspora sp. 6V TaxID=2877239 RepID=UPI001CD415A6|nr:ParB N-terminal domain-containing protein [Saccharopolyspora sp. 6V]MCA1196245.1 ParB N-terminal domain-containing protein [Saccharopolyspora sp. 6V]
MDSVATADGSSTSGAPEIAEGDVELLRVDPRDLIIGVNVRSEAGLTKGFLADIKQRGVRQPIIARRRADGSLIVREGQRRALAAVEAGLSEVRVLVSDARDSDDDDRGTIERVIDQLGENEHRCRLAERDELAATQELLDLGLSARQIARKRSVPAKRVQSTVTVARSAAATGAVEAGLDLVQAGFIAEFDGDDEAQAELRETASTRPAQLAHVAQRWRDQRAEEAALAVRTGELVEQGVTVIDRPYLYPDGLRRLSALRPTPESEPGSDLDPEQHVHCPGHAVFLDYSRPTGQVEEIGVCQDFIDHGHAERFAPAGQATRAPSNGGELTEQERTAKKAHRRTVIDHGKAWDSATTLRRDWLRKFAARRTAPKDAPAWTAQAWADGGHCLRKALTGGHELAAELLGVSGGSAEIARMAEQATPGRAAVILTVLAMAAIEAGTDRRHTWERPDDLQRRYFAQLQQWGYEPAEVEALVTAEASSTTGDAEASPDSGEAA